MKKIFITVTMLAITSTTMFVACKKDAKNTTSFKGAKSTARIGTPIYATFADTTAYETFLNDTSSAQIPNLPSGFISLKSIIDLLEWQRENDSNNNYATYYANPNLADTVYEDYGKLLDVLNEDKIVNLFGNLVRIDLVNGHAYSIESTTTAAYDSLLDYPNAANITTYEEGEEIIPILAKATGGCNESKAAGDSDPKTGTCDSRNQTKKLIVYQRGWIYFSLLAEAKNQKKTLGVWWAKSGVTPTIEVIGLGFRVRCEDYTYYYSGDASGFTVVGGKYNSDSRKTTFRPYESGKALAAYRFDANIGGTCEVNYLKIQKP